MNRRIFPRYDLMQLPLFIDIIDTYNEPSLGKVRDISKGGISFYSTEDTLVSKDNNVIDVLLFLDAKCYSIEVEILREISLEDGQTLHAGRFLGIPNEINNTFPNVLTENAERELVYL